MGVLTFTSGNAATTIQFEGAANDRYRSTWPNSSARPSSPDHEPAGRLPMGRSASERFRSKVAPPFRRNSGDPTLHAFHQEQPILKLIAARCGDPACARVSKQSYPVLHVN